ncbi:MAG: Mrp/NBP35 family ATP-binding protein [Rhodospirillales bacterium]
MTGVDHETVLAALRGVMDPDMGTGPDMGADVVSLDMVKGLQIKDGHVAFALEVAPERGAALEPLRKQAEKAVFELPGVITATVVLTAERPASKAAQAAPAPSPGKSLGASRTPQGELMPGVSRIIAVASGKGGVGKSTTAANLALGFAASGLKTGVLDADIYGPSMPRMFGISGRPSSPDGKRLDPMESYGIKLMSMGFLVDEETPMIWRGPMVQSALEQMMRDVNWGELDVLVVDMPPGTGDVQLTMAQRVPLSGAVIVSTPQDIALLDARKGLNMFRKVDVPVLGIIENMSYFLCPDNGKRYDIFGHGGARREAERLGVPFLGEVPIEIEIRETSDAGQPITVSAADGKTAETYRAIAKAVWDGVGEAETAGPRIVIQ